MSRLAVAASAAGGRAYWRSVLADVPLQHGLPRHRNVQPTDSPTYGRHDSTIDAGVLRAVRRVAAEAGCTCEQLLLAAFQALLFRYTDATPLVVACQIGAAPDVWPVRAAPALDRTFLDLLAGVRSACESCAAAGAAPLDIVARLPLRFSASTVARDHDEPSSGKLHLSVTIAADDGIHARWVWNTHRYGASFVEAMARHYSRLMESAAAHPDAAIGDLDLVAPDERERLCTWSAGPPVTSAPDFGHVRFDEQVAPNRSKAAVVFPGGALTYAELDARANQMARFLQDHGVGPDVPVAICLRRSPELVIAYVGVLKAGGAIFLLDPSTPTERRRTLLDVVRPAIVITQAALDHGVSSPHWPAVCFDRIASQLDDRPATAPDNRITVESTAFLLTTSGSTGAPKVVRHPVRYRRVAVGFESNSLSAQPSDDRHLLKSDSGTGFTHAEITRALFTGGTLFIAPEGIEYDASALAAFVAEHRISCLLTTPSQLSMLLDADGISRCDALRVVDCIGEMLSPELKQRVWNTFGQCSLVVSYGCTEALGATCRTCSRTDDDPAVVDVGQTAPLMEVFVLDAQRRLCPIGVPGEVYLGGALAAEYVNDPDETAERFVPHRFNAADGARLFRTGDVGRWLPDGRLQIVGRCDRQVKIRGYRVELGEIEAVLARCPGVAQAAVVVREDELGDKRIAAYVVETPGHRTDASDIRAHLHERLPDYMMPAWIVTLPALPLTNNGKLDRAALPAPDADACRTREYEAPHGDVEVMLAAVWSDVLQIDRVGRQDDFFELGGHSLLAQRLIARLRQHWSIDVRVRDVFMRPVFADLAEYVERAGTVSQFRA